MITTEPGKDDIREVSEEELEDAAGGSTTAPWPDAIGVQPLDWRKRFQTYLQQTGDTDYGKVDEDIRSWAQAVDALPVEIRKKIKAYLDQSLAGK